MQDNAVPTDQYTALVLRYLLHQTQLAQRSAARVRAQQEGVASPQSDADDDDDEDASHSPDNGDAANWSSYLSNLVSGAAHKRRESAPALDLIDWVSTSNIEARHRLRQWLGVPSSTDNGQFDFDEIPSEKDKNDVDQKENVSTSEMKECDPFKLWANDPAHRPLLRSTDHYIPSNFQHLMQLREIGHCPMWFNGDYGAMTRCSDELFPNQVIETFTSDSRVFCCDFSCDGNVLCAASQDHVIHLIDARSGANSDHWPIYKQVESQFSGWSVIDVALSPDHEFVAYSGWASSIFLVNTYGSHELHEAHDLQISSFNSWGRCCVFGIEFDPQS